MKVPQAIIIILYAMSLGLSLAKHGESKGEYNFWHTLVSAIIEFLILKWGGFF